MSTSIFSQFIRGPNPVNPATGGDAGQTNQNQTSWIFTTLARGVATLAGIIAVLSGIMDIITLQFTVGVLLILEGFVVTLIESPCCFVYLNFADIPSKFFDSKPHWYRAVLYLVFGLLPVFSYSILSAVFSSALFVAASGAYLVLSLGKKASLEEMRAKASISENPSAILVNNEQLMDNRSQQPATFAAPVALGDFKQSSNLGSNSVITY